jgi:hypothetical protein
MFVFDNQRFDGLREFDTGRTRSELRFVGCFFQSCSVGLSTDDLVNRVHLVNAEFCNCCVAGCNATAAIIEDVLVDGLKTSNLFQTWATIFKHVKFKGKVDRIMLSDLFHPGHPDSKFQKVIAQANSCYYADVDWAIDISEAEFKDFDCRGVPARLVRRDPETQVVVTRDRAIAAGTAIAAGGHLWESWIKNQLIVDGYQDIVLVAAKRDPRFKEQLSGLRELRRQGVVVPD